MLRVVLVKEPPPKEGRRRRPGRRCADVSELARRHGDSESVVVVRRLGPGRLSFSAIGARGLYDNLTRPSGSAGASADSRTQVDYGGFLPSFFYRERFRLFTTSKTIS